MTTDGLAVNTLLFTTLKVSVGYKDYCLTYYTYLKC